VKRRSFLKSAAAALTSFGLGAKAPKIEEPPVELPEPKPQEHCRSYDYYRAEKDRCKIPYLTWRRQAKDAWAMTRPEYPMPSEYDWREEWSKGAWPVEAVTNIFGRVSGGKDWQ
jgi:hypothetical protein